MSTFVGFANSGISGSPCGATQVQADDSPSTQVGQALENNVAQLSQIAVNVEGSSAPSAIAAFDSESLYFEANGVYNTNPYVGAVTITSSLGVKKNFSAQKMTENGVSVSSANDLNNTYPTARTLFNAYRTSTVRASVAGFLNWICDTQNGVNTIIPKQTDPNTGVNYDLELTNIIVNQFGFNRLTDLTPAGGSGGQQNNSCQLVTSVATPSS